MNSDKTPYELWFGRPASVKYFRVFGSKCYIKRDDDNLSLTLEPMKAYFLDILPPKRHTNVII